MAKIVEKWTQRCGTCGIAAYVTEWDCGCVDARFDESARGCRRCWESRDLVRHCGKEGRPVEDPPRPQRKPRNPPPVVEPLRMPTGAELAAMKPVPPPMPPVMPYWEPYPDPELDMATPRERERRRRRGEYLDGHPYGE